MRKFVKKQILDIIETLFQAHDAVRLSIDSNDKDNVISLLEDCQNTAIEVGNILDDSNSNEADAIHLLEEYCEVVYRVSVESENGIKGNAAREMLDNSLRTAEKHIRENVKERLEIVFMPYKASMWDSLESVWKAADDDPDCDAYVVPIPYYDRNPDRSFGKYHYEGREYPKYVPITHYDNYDLAAHRPDIIYIHNPYDANNYVTSVDPRFYSKELKKYTETLIYIPYFVLNEPENITEEYLNKISSYCLQTGVYNADRVIVQSELIRKSYIELLLRETTGISKNREYLEEKIVVGGSPKFEKVINTKLEDVDIPEHWTSLIVKPNGERKKVIFFNTSLDAMINNREKMIQKIKNVLRVFYNYRDNVILLWRPHPLMEATLKSMFPELYVEYKQIVKEYVRGAWGIYDDTPDLNRAIALCSAYYGDGSSVVHLVKKVNKLIMIQNVNIDN